MLILLNSGRRRKVKRLVVIMVIFCMFLTMSNTFSAGSRSISFDEAKDLLLKNSTILKKMEIAQTQAKNQYISVVDAARNIDVQKMNIGGFFIYYDKYTQMLMTKQKVLLPEQMNYMYEKAFGNKVITIKRLVVNLRNLYVALYNADCEVKAKQGIYELCKKIYHQSELKYKERILSYLDFEEVGYNLKKAETELEIARRNKQNSSRLINQNIGLPVNEEYSVVVFNEKKKNSKMNTDGYYIDEAIINRFEVVDLERQIRLNELELSILEENLVYKINEQVEEEHKKLLLSIQELKFELEKNKLHVEIEIRNAYKEILNQQIDINSLSKVIKRGKDNLKLLNSRYELGITTYDVIEQAKIEIVKQECVYNALVFNYNTALTRLENASSIGPGF